jgi:hypothetical protein
MNLPGREHFRSSRRAEVQLEDVAILALDRDHSAHANGLRLLADDAVLYTDGGGKRVSAQQSDPRCR